MNNFINISDLSQDKLRFIIDSAKKRKSERGEKPNSQPDIDKPLHGKTMIMFFEKTSTRTRISFDLAVKQLGGSSIILNQDEIHYGKGDENIKDTAKVLSQYADILMITRSADGVSLFNGSDYHHIPTKARQVHDVSGAGDTVIAAFTLSDLCGATPEESVEISNYAAGRVCEEVGVVPISLDMLNEMLDHHNSI